MNRGPPLEHIGGLLPDLEEAVEQLLADYDLDDVASRPLSHEATDRSRIKTGSGTVWTYHWKQNEGRLAIGLEPTEPNAAPAKRATMLRADGKVVQVPHAIRESAFFWAEEHTSRSWLQISYDGAAGGGGDRHKFIYPSTSPFLE